MFARHATTAETAIGTGSLAAEFFYALSLNTSHHENMVTSRITRATAAACSLATLTPQTASLQGDWRPGLHLSRTKTALQECPFNLAACTFIDLPHAPQHVYLREECRTRTVTATGAPYTARRRASCRR